eukprot:3158525-Prymnesium_polylepis.1
MLYFYPRALPSTFESERGAERRHATLCRARATATLQLLAKLEDDAAGNGRKAKRAAAQRLLAMQMLTSRGAPPACRAARAAARRSRAPLRSQSDDVARQRPAAARRPAPRLAPRTPLGWRTARMVGAQ